MADDAGKSLNRAELVTAMCSVLKASRRNLAPPWDISGLNPDGWYLLDSLVDRLVRHPNFEHLERRKIRSALHDIVREYRAVDDRPALREYASAALGTLAQEPLRRKVFLGVEHLRVPHGTVVGEVTFLDPAEDPELLKAFERFGAQRPALVCEVEVSAGTPSLLRERAVDVAETALALIRQQNLFGFSSKIYLDQVLYRLDGMWTWRDQSGTARAGWWRAKPKAIPMDLAHPNGEPWRRNLADLSRLYSASIPPLRDRVDACIAWLDVAALSDRWRVMIPAVFSGIEALLVPEVTGLKAAVVTVRSIAVRLALDKGFFDPDVVIDAYLLRNDLIHGSPTTDVLNEEASRLADWCRRWAFETLGDILTLAQITGAQSVRQIVERLDAGKCKEACIWLEDNGGIAVANEYREALGTSERE